MVKQAVPTVKNVSYPFSGVGAFHCYISIKKTAEGQAKQAILAALAADHYLKMVVVVDEDINVYRDEEVLWAIATRSQASKNIFIISDVMGCLLDPTSAEGLTSKIGIDATKPIFGFAKECEIPIAVQEKIIKLLSKLKREEHDSYIKL
jgi:UbiD family decarboxylase